MRLVEAPSLQTGPFRVYRPFLTKLTPFPRILEQSVTPNRLNCQIVTHSHPTHSAKHPQTLVTTTPHNPSV